MMPEIGWHATFRLEKFCARCLSPELIASGRVRPFEVIEDDGNLPLFLGLSEMWERLIGGTPSGDPFDETNAYIAVGNDGRPTNQTMTGLIGASTARQAMDTSYPQHTDGTTDAADKIVFRATFPDGAAEFAWAEVGIANAATDGILLNRRPTAYGVKPAGQIWSISITLRFYGTENGSAQPPTGSPSGTLPGSCFCTPTPGGGGGALTDDVAQYIVATGDMTDNHVVMVHIVRMPGIIRVVDVLSSPASDVEWQVSRAGSPLFTASANGDVVWTTPLSPAIEVVSGDLLECKLLVGDVADFSTLSILVEERTDRNKQIVWADNNGGAALAVGIKGQHIMRYSGVIRTYDVMQFPEGGGVDWVVRKNGVSIGTFSTGGSAHATGGSLDIPVAAGDIFEFEITTTSVAEGSTISLNVQRS